MPCTSNIHTNTLVVHTILFSFTTVDTFSNSAHINDQNRCPPMHGARSWIASPDAVNPNYTTGMNNTSLHVLTRPSKQLLLLGVLAHL